MSRFRVVPLALLLALWAPARADAALTVLNSFVGNVAVSTDGFGSTSQSGTISANVPAGATVLAAYLFTSTFENPTHAGVGGTLNGNALAYGAPSVTPDSCCALASSFVNVTSIVKPVIDGGPGGLYNFTVTETSSSQDGEALVVVYSHPSLPVATVGVLTGFSATTGDNFAINFADPLNPADPAFFAEMRLGIGFSCCNQTNTVEVNGTVITTNAGNNDDGTAVANGSLITVGGFDDPFSPFLPSYTEDHERYNLATHVNVGDTTIAVRTENPSRDDNIFLAVFHVFGRAGINEEPPDDTVPEPGTLALLSVALAGIAARRHRSRAS